MEELAARITEAENITKREIAKCGNVMSTFGEILE